MADRKHPLAAIAATSSDATDVRLTLSPLAQRLIVRGNTSGLGLAVPDACRATVSGERSLLWLGPDEFLLLAPEEAESHRLPGTVDVSHRDVVRCPVIEKENAQRKRNYPLQMFRDDPARTFETHVSH